MTSPGNNVDTSKSQGGTGGGAQPPASNKDTANSTGGTEATGTDPDLTGSTDSHARDPKALGDTQPGEGIPGGDGSTIATNAPKTTPPDTSGTSGGIGATATPAYAPPPTAPPASNRDTTAGGGLGVNSGSPDAAVVGNGVTNPNAVEPSPTALPSGYATGGTKETANIGAGQNYTAPTAAPTSVTAAVVPNQRAVLVSWTPPAGAITSYIVESNTNGTQRAPGNAHEVEFEDGLIGGDSYSFTVYAVNQQGSGPRSAVSNTVVIPKTDIRADTTRADGL